MSIRSEDRRGFLKDACSEVRKHDMPLQSYTWIHTNARLSDRDIQTICDWTSTVLRAGR
jgi:hypothetical protein